jgi:terminase small subunit / prophage DNA-packing protein
MGGCVLDRVLTQAEFGELVGITQQAVSDLARRGVLKPNVTGLAWLRAYCSHLREEAAGRAGVLADASAALKNVQREEVELRVALKRREAAPVSVIALVLAKVGRQCAGILDGLIPAIRRRWPSVTAEQLKFIDAEVARVRNLMASVSIDDLKPDDKDEE